MANQIPDPRSLESWEDAFQHPLPVVRKLEQQLRKNIDDNLQKLRSLVGTSYRDLLGTAERIMEMDDQMQTVESYLSDIGKKCNARTVERIAENQGRMRASTFNPSKCRNSALAQTKVFQSALMMLSRTIKSGGDALLAAKLHVLARLLHKSVSESDHAPPVLEALRRKLASLRKNLLSYIERTVVKESRDKGLLTNTLCAYSLATSSNLKDTLRFFLKVRYEQLDSKLDSPSESDFLQMLELYSQTVLDCRDLFPRRISEDLSQLARSPLLRDEQVISVFELNLDIYGSWIPEDVRTFTPWVRHDQLSSTEVADALTSWSGQAQNCLLQGLQEHLSQQNDASDIIRVRSKVITKYLKLANHMRSENFTESVHELRAIFLKRLEELFTQQTSSIRLALNDPDGMKSSQSAQLNTADIWDLATENFDFSHGAFKFRQSNLRSRHGRDERIEREVDNLDKWVAQIDSFINLTDDMTATRWYDDLDLDLDDITDSRSLQNALSVKDPKALREALRTATQEALGIAIEEIMAVAEQTEHAAFYLRLRREVDQRCRILRSRLDVQFSMPSADALYRNIATSVASNVTEAYIQLAQDSFRPAVTLWDGSPPLPVQPSPTVFKFLTQLHRTMSEAGSDLWSIQCVLKLKDLALTSLSTGLLDTSFTGLNCQSALVNGHSETGGYLEGVEEDLSGIANLGRDQAVQRLFDVHYLQRALNRGKAHQESEAGVMKLIEALRSTLDVDEASGNRLEKNAGEYWKKTYLLFGLLATSSE